MGYGCLEVWCGCQTLKHRVYVAYVIFPVWQWATDAFRYLYRFDSSHFLYLRILFLLELDLPPLNLDKSLRFFLFSLHLFLHFNPVNFRIFTFLQFRRFCLWLDNLLLLTPSPAFLLRLYCTQFHLRKSLFRVVILFVDFFHDTF